MEKVLSQFEAYLWIFEFIQNWLFVMYEIKALK